MSARSPSVAALACWLIGITVLALIAIGPPGARKPVAPPAPTGPVASSVSANGFTLTSEVIDMPIDDAAYPDGLHVEVVNANCTSCHSPSMALVQPALSADKWKEIVLKMRDVYHAPIAEKDVAPIVSYLSAEQATRLEKTVHETTPPS